MTDSGNSTVEDYDTGKPVPDEMWNSLFPSSGSASNSMSGFDLSDYFDQWIGGLTGDYGNGGASEDYGDYNDTAGPAPMPVVMPPPIMPSPPAKHRRLSSSIANRIIQFYETAAPEEKTFIRRVVRDLDEYLKREQNGAEEGTMSASMW